MIASQTYVLQHISKNYILRSIALCHPQHHANPHEPHNETLSESSTLRVLCTLLTGAAVSWRCPRGLEEDHLLLVVGGEAGLVLGVDTGHQWSPGTRYVQPPQSPEIRQKLTQTPPQLQPVSSPRPGPRLRRQQSGYILHFTRPRVIAPAVCMTRLGALSRPGHTSTVPA